MRRLVPVVGWIAAAGCCTHPLTLVILRAFSLTGVHPIHYPPGEWLSLDRRDADLQDVFLNEPRFFIERCLWALFAVGVLSGLGALPTFRSG